jgi:hypothetical protein
MWHALGDGRQTFTALRRGPPSAQASMNPVLRVSGLGRCGLLPAPPDWSTCAQNRESAPARRTARSAARESTPSATAHSASVTLRR